MGVYRWILVFFNGNGYRQTGFVEIAGIIYHFDSDGKMSIGWEKINDILPSISK